jgi:hypothetical protein
MKLVRIIAMLLTLLGGCGAILYGALFHVVAVEEEKQRETSIMVPTLPGFGDAPPDRGEAAMPRPPAPPEMPPGDADPFSSPPNGDAPAERSENPFEPPPALPAPPGMRLEKVTEKYVESEDSPEWSLVREVTFGGVRLDNGQLKRTYSGQPPALCPS